MRCCGAHEIDDGVHCTDLVEVHVIERHAVRLGLGLAEPREKLVGALLDRRDQRCAIQELANVRERAAVTVLVVVMAVGVIMAAVGFDPRRFRLVRIGTLDEPSMLAHPEPHSCEPSAASGPRLDGDPMQAESRHRLLEHRERHAEVEAGTEKHVAGQAARAVEMVVPHAAKATTPLSGAAKPSPRRRRE